MPSGFDNDTMFADNVDFSGSGTVEPRVTADGELLIGSSVDPKIRVSTLTAGSGVSIVNGQGTITISATATPTDDLHVARFIVSPGGASDGANFTTIASAYAAAVSSGAPQDVFIQPGTYNEDITATPGISLVAFGSDALDSSGAATPSPSVVIEGTVTLSDAGTYNFTGITFKTDGATAIDITGSNSLRLNLNSCLVWAFDAVGMTQNNANSFVSTYNSNFRQTDVNPFFAGTSGSAVFNGTKYNNTGSPTTSTVDVGTYQFNNCNISGLQVTTSSTGKVVAQNTSWLKSNTILLTMAGTGTSEIYNCRLESGTSSACSIGAGCTLNISNTSLSSSNAAVITGAGTVNYGGLTFTSTSSTINATTQTRFSEGPSRTIGSSNSGGTNNLTITNTSNTASSNALSQITVAGTSAGDPFQTFTVTGGASWSQGADNSDSDAFVVAASTALGTTNIWRMTTDGNSIASNTANVGQKLFDLYNTDNTGATSEMKVLLRVGGTAAGSPYINYRVTSGNQYSFGPDNTETGDPMQLTTGIDLTSGSLVWNMTPNGERTMPLQPAFLATLQTSDLNVTGNGASYVLGSGNALTEAFDQGGDFVTTGTFTAPVTGRYCLGAQLYFAEVTAAMTAITLNLVTSALTYPFHSHNAANARQVASAADLMSVQGHIFCNMTAGDTFTVNCQIAGGAGNTADCSANAGRVNMYGYLVC